jgi:enoyl-CoA hydratase
VESNAFEGLKVELRDDGVGVVLFDRPDRFNALTAQTLGILARALHSLGGNEKCGAIVVSGVGQAFCAGMDLTDADLSIEGRDPVPLVYSAMRDAVSCLLAIREIPQPVIAAVRGPAVGGGFALAAAADIRFCSADAVFLAPFVKLGVSIGDMGLSWMLPRLIGVSRAAEILYTGREVGAEEADRIGLVSRVVPDGEAVAAAMEVARVMLSKSAFGLRMTKEVLDINVDAPSLESALQLENRTQQLAVRSDAFIESIERFSARSKSR